MVTFIDPRSNPNLLEPPPRRTTADPGALAELHRLCREGRLYEIEDWIRADRPLQISAEMNVGKPPVTSALEIALESGCHSLVHLLLCNGYDPSVERRCPLNLAFKTRRSEFVKMLLDAGADPHRARLSDLFETYNSDLLEQFYGL